MSEPARCRMQYFIPRIFRESAEPAIVTCNRLLTDPCGFCVVYNQHKHEWAAIYNEYRTPARRAVDGDIL